MTSERNLLSFHGCKCNQDGQFSCHKPNLALLANNLLFFNEGWLRITVVERQSLTGELSMSCARPVGDG